MGQDQISKTMDIYTHLQLDMQEDAVHRSHDLLQESVSNDEFELEKEVRFC